MFEKSMHHILQLQCRFKGFSSGEVGNRQDHSSVCSSRVSRHSSSVLTDTDMPVQIWSIFRLVVSVVEQIRLRHCQSVLVISTPLQRDMVYSSSIKSQSSVAAAIASAAHITLHASVTVAYLQD